MARHTILSIEDDGDELGLIHVVLVSATQMSFDISWKGLEYSKVIREICHVAPAMMELDHVMMEQNDGARIEAKPVDILTVNRFARKFRAALSNVNVYLTDQFSGDEL